MSYRNIAALVAAVALSLMTVACGGDNEGDSDGDPAQFCRSLSELDSDRLSEGEELRAFDLLLDSAPGSVIEAATVLAEAVRQPGTGDQAEIDRANETIDAYQSENCR